MEEKNKMYRLRNGVIVLPRGFCGVTVVDCGSQIDVEDGWRNGDIHYLLGGTDADPKTWVGGAHGSDFDVVSEVEASNG